MEVEKKYFTRKQLDVIKKMEKGKWYNAYELDTHFLSLKSLLRYEVIDVIEEEHEAFFSSNIHYRFKLKDEFELIENRGKEKKKKEW